MGVVPIVARARRGGNQGKQGRGFARRVKPDGMPETPSKAEPLKSVYLGALV
jgi:hypothetical protein